MAKILYADVIRIHSWTKGEKTQAESGGMHVYLHMLFPSSEKSHRAHFPPVTEGQEYVLCFCPEIPTKEAVPKLFIGTGHVWKFQTVQGKQVLGINYIVCTV